MARIISVINDKGGVAKTTTVFNLGTALWLLGKKVLLVDNDHQHNLTSDICKEALHAEFNLKTWMEDGTSEIPVYTRYDGLDYIPSCDGLEDLNVELAQRVGSDRFLDIRLKALCKQYAYDYILIDCGPGGGTTVNVNALEASSDVIIPIRTDSFSVQGKSILQRRIREIQDLGYPLQVAGVLLTQFDPRTEMAKNVKTYFSDYSKEHPDMPIFPVQIHKCEAANKAHGTQMSLYEYDASCIAADDYMRLAEYLTTGSLLRKKTWTPKQWDKKANAAFEQFLNEQQQ